MKKFFEKVTGAVVANVKEVAKFGTSLLSTEVVDTFSTGLGDFEEATGIGDRICMEQNLHHH